jgi:hypothetical protein
MLIKGMNIDLSIVELFNELAGILESTHRIIQPHISSYFDVERLLHCGVNVEFSHSFAFSIMGIKSDTVREENSATIIENFKKSVLRFSQKPSQLSSSPPKIAGDLAKNEIVLDAISRSIQDLREWMDRTGALDSQTHDKLGQLLDRATEVYDPIKAQIKIELRLD